MHEAGGGSSQRRVKTPVFSYSLPRFRRTRQHRSFFKGLNFLAMAYGHFGSTSCWESQGAKGQMFVELQRIHTAAPTLRNARNPFPAGAPAQVRVEASGGKDPKPVPKNSINAQVTSGFGGAAIEKLCIKCLGLRGFKQP